MGTRMEDIMIQAVFGFHPAIQTLPAYAIINIGETACNHQHKN